MKFRYYLVLLHQKLTTTKAGEVVTEIGIELVPLLFDGDVTLEDVVIAFVNGLISAGFSKFRKQTF